MAEAELGVQRLEAEVVGRVQGVGFRYFVLGRAVRLGLNGWVRNLADDRRVSVVAEGPHARLEQLLEALRLGPPGSHVERVEVAWTNASGAFDGFSVRH